MTFPDNAAEPEGAMGNFLSHLPSVLWERRWWIVLPLIVGLLFSTAAVFLIKPVYESQALMLVQSAQLPKDVIGTMDSEVIDRRIARIKQQVTSRPDLISIIERHGLYSDDRRSTSLSDVIDEMRDSISITPSVVNLPANQADQRTVAFQLAFQYSEPVAAQAVTQDLMDRILELDAKGNVEQATNTEQFLSEQARGLKENIADVESQLAEVNARYGRVLSSGGGYVGGNLGSYDVQIASLQRDNANLIAQKDMAQSSDTRAPVVVNAEAALAAARAVYAENHPDVVLARQRLAEARELAKNTAQNLPLQSIDQQIAFNNSQIATLRSAKAQEQAQMNSQIAAQSQGPLVQQQVATLQQSLSGLNQQYQEVQARLTDARAGVRAEDEQMAERLSVVEPPIIADSPVWPDRLLIFALGIGGGLAFGFCLALGMELVLRPIRDPDEVTAITGQVPLAIVPVIRPRTNVYRDRLSRLVPHFFARG
ncbi:lipopolysaccharide biosynthesis protein [Altererythrobacter salegens]|uniref:Lipopolysaccharide biosynthesis protein n=1 Tax=Croceibacterium salegens TaxID=1737568 RepID=A0A6I4SX96_9SPHN|nr:Wzz/FepE/Etk N-terminal domain-containing protein [Croceibacterium salegens]MXO60714.1 lipopolysaccharide biosynthesis protein [Croceibacterium salegens]